MSDNEFQVLLEHAKRVEMSSEQIEAQRRSFAFGNANIENDAVTREMVDQAAETLKKSDGPPNYNQTETSKSDSR
jgi:hypothetical protein